MLGTKLTDDIRLNKEAISVCHLRFNSNGGNHPFSTSH